MADSVETAIYRLRVEGQAEIDRLTKSVDGLAVAEEKATTSTRTFSQSLQNQVARIDPLVKAQEQYRKALETNARYRESGVGTETQLNAQLSAATQRYQQQVSVINQVEKATTAHANATKLSRHELINLGRQAQDVGVSLIGGQGLFTILAQQGSQIFDVFTSSTGTVRGFFSQMIEGAKGFLSPMNLAIGAVVSFGAAAIYSASQFASAQKDIERSLLGIGAQSGATAAKINAFAQIGPRESITGMSPGERREVGTEFARTGAIDVSKLNGVTEAVRAYAVIAGKDATEATKDLAKALGGDLVKAVDELEKTYGALNPALKDTVRNFLLLGDRAAAQQTIVDEVAAANKRALGTITPLSAGWSGLVNILSMVAEGYGKILSYKVFETEGQKAGRTAREQAAADAAAQQQQNLTIGKGIRVVEDYTPEIEQINRLNLALADLVRAKIAAAAAGKTFDDGDAEQKIRNTIVATNDAKAASIAWQQTIAQVSAEWQGVSQSAAMALHAQEGQLSVINAIGGAAKMAAQYALDYQTTWEKTHNAVEATAVATMNLLTAQAQVNAQAKETLWSLENQANVIAAVTEAERMAAQETATRNRLLHDGVDALLAQQVAAQELANAQAAANAAIDRQVRSLERATELTRARGSGNEALVKASQAYDIAIESGADSTRAAALSSATLANEMANAAKSSNEMAKGAEATMKATDYATPWWERWKNTTHNAALNVGLAETSMGGFVDSSIIASSKLSGMVVSAQSLALALQDASYVPKNIDEATYQYDTSGAGYYPDPKTQNKTIGFRFAPEGGAGGGGDFVNDPLNLLGLAKLGASGSQFRNIGLEQYGYDINALFGPEPAKEVETLTDSIDRLKDSTDSLNATNQELLSPYYTMDPRTSHIGFRSQGMANGGYVDVPGGYSANDNMMAMVPVASGERIYVDPMTGRRGTGGGGMVVNISSPIIINGNANADQFGRTVFQANQQLAKQVRAAAQ